MEHGGVYIDMDARLTWPLDCLIGRDDRELFVLDRHGRVTNFFVASEPEHPALAEVIGSIMENIEAKRSNDVFQLTGPGALTSAITGERLRVEPQRYVCDQGNFTNEYFQYLDHPIGKWTEEQKQTSLLGGSRG
jgi:mannosyltransferase OCH1-like enzyme